MLTRGATRCVCCVCISVVCVRVRVRVCVCVRMCVSINFPHDYKGMLASHNYFDT